MCPVHRFEHWTLSARPAVGTDTSPDDAQPDSRTTTHQTISRAEWLRLEIDAAESYSVRHHDSDDEIEQSQVQRRQRDLAVLQAELAMGQAHRCGTEVTFADEPHFMMSDIYVCEGWWHPNVKSGQVHDHPNQPGRSFSVAMHRLCEPVYTKRDATR